MEQVLTHKEIIVAQREEKLRKEEKSVTRRQPGAARPRIIQAIRDYFTEMLGELRKVSWPTRKEALNLTKIVLLVMVVMSIVLGILDFLFSKFFALLFA